MAKRKLFGRLPKAKDIKRARRDEWAASRRANETSFFCPCCGQEITTVIVKKKPPVFESAAAGNIINYDGIIG